MKRLRTIRKWGNSWVLVFTPSDSKDYELKDGERYTADIEDIIIKKIERGNK